MPVDPLAPVIIGVAQKTRRGSALPGPEPLLGWEEVVRLAADDASISSADLSLADFVEVADCMSWFYDNAPGRLAERLGAYPTRTYYSQPSGTSGHTMLHNAVNAIRDGTSQLAVIAGGESLATRKLLARAGEEPNWSYPAAPDHPPALRVDEYQHPAEAACRLYEGVGAVYLFAMRDIARRAHLGVAPDTYRQQLGNLMAGMTRVAASNPDAWFPAERSTDFIIEPRVDNRMITYPYTKYMVSIIDVDMFGAMIVTNEAHADQLGVPRQKRIYPWTACYARDPVYTASRPDLWKSNAMRAAAKALFDYSELSQEQVKYVDLYSCFPAAVNFGRDALGMSDRPGEQVTLTGGLPYGGGPASSYMMTSMPKMVGALRADPGAFGIASGLGMMMQNHAFGLYSSEPPPSTMRRVVEKAVQAEVDRIPLIPIDSGYVGPATIATYTVMHDRQGNASHGAAICDLPSGARAYARLDLALLEEAEKTEFVGQKMSIVAGSGAGTLRA